MSGRALDPALQAAIDAGLVVPCLMAALTFRSSTQYVWTGIGPLVYDAQTYTGVGSLASIGTVSEGLSVEATGLTIGLSGIDPTLYAASISDIQIGAPALVYFALLSQGVIVGAPYLLFAGQVDKPVTTTGPDSIEIALQLETRMTHLQRPSQLRYTDADQRMLYPDDTAFTLVPQLCDQALIWGQ